ncbi:MAG: 1-deoxy-D-xylulose-5-phosphate synthase [Candidatus Aureabacteria bacterium]|nr:1-deoxy-D-xylulose-5-phosphate synthase [Candidatus Auribacterota bacterium]
MGKLLDRINNPSDIKCLSAPELKVLCSEIRDVIIDSVSRNGGHLASSLGTVELTVALHYVFNTPDDKIVWDVGHQAYAHKIVTGRKDRFDTIRRKDGLSGFPKPEESLYDSFVAGHASTSVSVAGGMALARDKNAGNYDVIAVIGDGSLTGGVAFEAMNNIGALGTKLIVILNGNEMAISPSVGALSKYLNKIISSPFYNNLKNDVESIVDKIPAVGKNLIKAAHRVEEAIKSLIVPGALFEELGFRYFGPIDGHNIELLTETINNVKHIDAPVIVHIVTKKGKGYEISEQHPELFHGTAPFNIKTGQSVKPKRGKTFTDIFGDEMLKLAAQDKSIVAITAAMCLGTGLSAFRKEFPDRLYDVGIAEQHAIAFAGGLAASGLKPVVAIYSTFLQRAVDQIFHEVCLMNLPVVIAVDRSGLVGEDGPTHHGVFDITYLTMLPNMSVVAPSDENSMRRLLRAALNLGSPCVIRYPKVIVSPDIVRNTDGEFIIGNWSMIKDGGEAVVMSTGHLTRICEEAVKSLNQKGHKVGLVDCYSIKPLDESMYRSILEKRIKIITVEENVIRGGFGSYLSEKASEMGFAPSMLHIGLEDRFVTHASRDELLELTGLDSSRIENAARKFLDS